MCWMTVASLARTAVVSALSILAACGVDQTSSPSPDDEPIPLPADDISIKATTTEKLGFVGRQEGVAAYATVIITTA